MKFECSLDKIKNAVIQTEKITGKNLTLPILTSILVIASGKSIKIRSTNLSLGIEIDIPGKIEKEGVVAIRGDVFSGALSHVNGDIVLFEQIKESVLIKTKNAKTIVKTLPHEDFPTIPIVTGNTIVLPSRKFIDGIRSVYYAASSSDIKPEISSVYMYGSTNDEITFVSTDSFRLAEKKIKNKNTPEFSPIIIPYKNITEIIRVLGDLDEELSIIINTNQIAILVSNIYITSRIIDGVFPDYQQIIPKESKTTAIVLKQDIVTALRATGVFSDKFNQVTIIVQPDKKEFIIHSINNDTGENTVSLAASLTGEAVQVNCNHRYITEGLSSIGVDSVSFDFSGHNRPVVVRGISDNSFIYLVMPMNN